MGEVSLYLVDRPVSCGLTGVSTQDTCSRWGGPSSANTTCEKHIVNQLTSSFPICWEKFVVLDLLNLTWIWLNLTLTWKSARNLKCHIQQHTYQPVARGTIATLNNSSPWDWQFNRKSYVSTKTELAYMTNYFRQITIPCYAMSAWQCT